MTYRIESGLVGKFGGINFPLDPSLFDSGSFVPFDPARSSMLALFKAAINYELRQVWPKLTGKLTIISDTNPVETTLELEPTSYIMKQLGVKYPLLALHRVGDQVWSEHTLAADKCEQEWNLHYILPNLEIGDQRRIVDVFRIIPEIVRRVIRQRGHAAYENGSLQFFSDEGGMGLGNIKMTRAESGQSKFGDNGDGPIWNATTITLITTEYGTDSADEFGTFDGVDWGVGTSSNHGTIPDHVQGWVDL
jgi:hypothetical protein